MTQLRRLVGAAFSDYLVSSAAGYAEDNVRAGRWPLDGAHERAAAELAALLPGGEDTPNNYLFEILKSPGKQSVGAVWFAVVENGGQRSAFIYDLEIKPEYRRCGYAKDALKQVERLVGELGIKSIGLHVFAFNEGARSLYEKLGYAVTGCNMQKRVDE